VLVTRSEAEKLWQAGLRAVVSGETAAANVDCGSGSLARTLWEGAVGLVEETARAAGAAGDEGRAALRVDCEQERVSVRRVGSLPEPFAAAVAERIGAARR
jgi:hypothetical protein